MASHVRGAVVREVDTNSLFERYDIEEIRDIEKKTRQDIERKKEDLRIMVGERYRELIEAADTISEMKCSAQNVMQSIGRIQDLCTDLRQAFQAKTFSSLSSKAKKDTNKQKTENHFYSMALNIKLLMDMPEKIWSALDSGDYLLSTRLFLLARHVHTTLQIDKNYGSKVHGWFPVLTCQWAAISYFRQTILQTCRNVLSDVSVSDKVTTECLCSILLLEDKTPRQVFNEFLLARSSSVNQLFQSDQGSVSIKSQICQVVKTIVTTVHQIHTIFFDGKDSLMECNLLMKVLAEATDRGEKGAIILPMEVSISSKYQSKGIFGYRPDVKQNVSAIPLSNLQENCLQWIDVCKETIKSGLSKLLGFITTVKGLAAIRDEVWEQLKEDENMNTWDSVCQQVAKRVLRLWEEFFKPYFMERTKALLQAQFDSAVALCQHQIGKVLGDVGNWDDRSTDCERNLANYVWSEGPNDIASNMAWTAVNMKTISEGAGLVMKSRCYTPAVQGLAKNFDSKIKVLLEDGSHYVKLPVDAANEKGPFDRTADREEVQLFIEDACQECMNKLLQHLNQQLYASRKQLESASADPRSCKVIIDRMLLLGRFCSALGELSPHLLQCIAPNRPLKKTRSQSKSSESTKWMEMKKKLDGFGREAFVLWINYMTCTLVRQFRSCLLENSMQALLRACTKWDDVLIEEETEDGEKIKSTIRVPMQISWYLQSLLYELCEEINRIGGHSLPRNILSEVVEKLSDGILESYEALTGSDSSDAQVTQNRALQLCFDLKALCNIMPRKEDTETNAMYHKRCQKVIEKLESKVDPFDLDVFMPYIRSHLSRHTQRATVLYGALISVDHHSTYTTASKPSLSVQQEQHNVLPLLSGTSRFSLLPLSLQSRQGLMQPIIQSPKPTVKTSSLFGSGHGGTASSPPALSPPSDDQNSSFFGQMSTIWFSNVSGKNK